MGLAVARALLVSLLSGCLFSIGWCLLIDGVVSAAPGQFLWYFASPAVLVTLSSICLNFIYADQIRASSSNFALGGGSDTDVIHARIWFYVMLTLSLCSIFGALWIVIDHFSNADAAVAWPGIALQLQTLLVAASGFCFFFGRRVGSSN
jgi:hypothetical protein